MFLLGLIGNPVEHSLSPLIHQQFAKQFDISLQYKKIFAPLDQFQNIANAFIKEGCLGFNITAPFKGEAFHLASVHSERAIKVRVVNTIKIQAGEIFGDNTDGVGFIKDLKQKNIILKDKTLIIAGAGGVVLGVLPFLFAEKPARIIIANRNVERLSVLTELYPVEVIPWDNLVDFLEEADIVFDGTSHSTALQEILLENLPNKNTIFYDLKYGHRALTPLIAWAQAHGYQAYDGLGMLIEQAAEAFHLWFGVMPDTQALHFFR